MTRAREGWWAIYSDVLAPGCVRCEPVAAWGKGPEYAAMVRRNGRPLETAADDDDFVGVWFSATRPTVDEMLELVASAEGGAGHAA